MSPAAQGNLELDQCIGNCLIAQSARAPKNNIHNFQRQNTRQFHNSHNRNTQQYHSEQIGKSYNGTRPQRYNAGFSRQTNFVDSNNGWANLSIVSPAQTNQRRYHHNPMNNHYNSKQRKDFIPNNENNRAPFSRIAVNNPNPPQIQNGVRFISSRNKSHIQRNNQKLYNKIGDSEKKLNQKDASGRTSDVLSNASDESSGNSENSLPRIIKPRKRRKKDRKPLTETTESQVLPVVETQVTQKPVTAKPSPVKPLSIVNMKPYAPLKQEQSKSTITIYSKQDFKSPPPRVENTSATIKNTSNEENIFSPLVTDSFVNLLLDEGKQNGLRSTPMPINKPLEKLLVTTKKDEEPCTVCQCRYCDPSGEIWDVEQRCYSPFLTPPSPNEPKLFVNSIRSVISGNLTKSNAASYLLRRSWSEPTESPLMTVVRSRNKSDSYEPNSSDLQVSSEIVTSPNGQRDIEIKFFSTPKRYSEMYKPSSHVHVPYSQLYLSTPPISPWRKDVQFGDLFSQSNEMRSSVNVTV